MSRTRFRVNPHSIVALMSGNSLLEAGAKICSLSDCNWNLTQNHLVWKRILNHLAKLAYLYLNYAWEITMKQTRFELGLLISHTFLFQVFNATDNLKGTRAKEPIGS